jgi:hypothetical protein
VTDKDYPVGVGESDSDFVLHSDAGDLLHLAFTELSGLPGDRWGSGTRVRVQLRDAPPRAARSLLTTSALEQLGSPLPVDAFAILSGDGNVVEGTPSTSVSSQRSSNPLGSISKQHTTVVADLKPANGDVVAPNVWVGPRPVADKITTVVFIVNMCGMGGGPAATPQVGLWIQCYIPALAQCSQSAPAKGSEKPGVIRGAVAQVNFQVNSHTLPLCNFPCNLPCTSAGHQESFLHSSRDQPSRVLHNLLLRAC